MVDEDEPSRVAFSTAALPSGDEARWAEVLVTTAGLRVVEVGRELKRHNIAPAERRAAAADGAVVAPGPFAHRAAGFQRMVDTIGRSPRQERQGARNERLKRAKAREAASAVSVAATTAQVLAYFSR